MGAKVEEFAAQKLELKKAIGSLGDGAGVIQSMVDSVSQELMEARCLRDALVDLGFEWPDKGSIPVALARWYLATKPNDNVLRVLGVANGLLEELVGNAPRCRCKEKMTRCVMCRAQEHMNCVRAFLGELNRDRNESGVPGAGKGGDGAIQAVQPGASGPG